MRLSLKFSLIWLATAAVLGTGTALVVVSARRIEVAQETAFARSLPVIDAVDNLRYLALALVSVTKRHVIDVAAGLGADAGAIETAAGKLRDSFDQFSMTVDAKAPELASTRDILRGKVAALEILARQIRTDMSFGAEAFHQSAELTKLKQQEADLIGLVNDLRRENGNAWTTALPRPNVRFCWDGAQ